MTTQMSIADLRFNSLYVVVTSPDDVTYTYNQDRHPEFHWSLLVTGSTMDDITMHRWAMKTEEDRRADQPQGEYQSVPLAATYTRTAGVKLVYLRIGTYQPPRPGYDWRGVLNEIQRPHLACEDDRSAGISCRTWVLQALQRVQADGLIYLTEDDYVKLEERMGYLGSQAWGRYENTADKCDFVPTVSVMI